jgi:uncharacterized protein YdcH (DUF465 family)
MEEHKAADERLHYLQNKLRLSAKESIEEVELKKAKLRAKERIYRIVEEHFPRSAAAKSSDHITGTRRRYDCWARGQDMSHKKSKYYSDHRLNEHCRLARSILTG